MEKTLRQWRTGGESGQPQRGLDITTKFVECWEIVSSEDSTARYCGHEAFLAGELHSLVSAAMGEEILDEAVEFLLQWRKSQQN